MNENSNAETPNLTLSSEPLSPEDAQYVYGMMLEVIEETNQPNRFQIRNEVTWLDAQGSKINEDNRERFEKMLADGDIKEIDSLVQDKKVMSNGLIYQMINVAKRPIKVNNTWWDAQGTKVNPETAARFEQQYKPIVFKQFDNSASTFQVE